MMSRVTEGRLKALLAELETLQTALAQLPALVAAVAALAESLGATEVAAPAPASPAHFLRQWRESRNKSLDDLAPIIGLSKAQLSRIERGHQAYTQRVLENYAAVLGCRTWDMLSHPPDDPAAALRPLFQQMRAAGRERGALEPTAQAPPAAVPPHHAKRGAHANR